jgi:hypothetical protein
VHGRVPKRGFGSLRDDHYARRDASQDWVHLCAGLCGIDRYTNRCADGREASYSRRDAIGKG